MDNETKVRILQSAKAELERHVWGTFVEGKASVALGGTGVVVSGCEACRKRFGTNSQYLRHLADDVLPLIVRKAFEVKIVGFLRGAQHSEQTVRPTSRA
jgi:hypothetical protein